MSMTRRQFNRLFMSSLAAASLPAGLLPATAQARTSTPTLIEGGNWAPIVPPQPGDNPGKIEVLEFFSYGCPHCHDFNPLVTRWAAKLPKDISFRRVPISFGRAAWSNLARLFYGLAAIGQLERMDQKVFDAIHVSKTNLYAEQAMLNWAARQGLDTRTLRDAMRSFGVENNVARAAALEGAYKVSNVPMLTVDGRYSVLNGGAKVLPDLLDFADGLIAKARQDRRPGKRR